MTSVTLTTFPDMPVASVGVMAAAKTNSESFWDLVTLIFSSTLKLQAEGVMGYSYISPNSPWVLEKSAPSTILANICLGTTEATSAVSWAVSSFQMVLSMSYKQPRTAFKEVLRPFPEYWPAICQCNTRLCTLGTR